MADTENNLILVADDEPSTRVLVANHLRNNGYRVLEAADGDEAWSLAEQHLPNLVILDVMMPGMSGWEVCRRIRESVSLAHTGVIVLTGIGENLNAMTSPLYGADAYVDKPFEFADLDRKVQDTLKARSAGKLGRPDRADVEPPSSPSPDSIEYLTEGSLVEPSSDSSREEEQLGRDRRGLRADDQQGCLESDESGPRARAPQQRRRARRSAPGREGPEDSAPAVATGRQRTARRPRRASRGVAAPKARRAGSALGPSRSSGKVGAGRSSGSMQSRRQGGKKLQKAKPAARATGSRSRSPEGGRAGSTRKAQPRTSRKGATRKIAGSRTRVRSRAGARRPGARGKSRGRC